MFGLPCRAFEPINGLRGWKITLKQQHIIFNSPVLHIFCDHYHHHHRRAVHHHHRVLSLLCCSPFFPFYSFQVFVKCWPLFLLRPQHDLDFASDFRILLHFFNSSRLPPPPCFDKIVSFNFCILTPWLVRLDFVCLGSSPLGWPQMNNVSVFSQFNVSVFWSFCLFKPTCWIVYLSKSYACGTLVWSPTGWLNFISARVRVRWAATLELNFTTILHYHHAS